MQQAAKAEYVTYPGQFCGSGFVFDDVGPFGVEGFAFGFVEALAGVGPEEVALGLEEVGGDGNLPGNLLWSDHGWKCYNPCAGGCRRCCEGARKSRTLRGVRLGCS